MTKAQKDSWELERARGRGRFVLKSVLKLGLPFGVWMMVIKALLLDGSSASIWEMLAEGGFYIVGFGALMGWINWETTEKEFLDPTEEEKV